ncbi:MAG: DUF4293 family protein [Bacteroidetes bacterium]|nr:MAG: DUF4293 family protein [Bacteroidota bacterium]
MIQRIQSLYLSLTTVLSLLFLRGSFLTFTDKSASGISLAFSGIYRGSSLQGYELIEKLLPLSVLIICIPVLSIATIFIYKNRKIQLWLASSLIILTVFLIIACVSYSWVITKEYNVTIVPGLKMVIPVLLLIFAIQAYRSIKKDDLLVKSYDRLR